MAKSLIKFCKSLRIVSVLPKYHIITRPCHSLQIKDINNAAESKASNSKELFELINKNKNPSYLVGIIEINKRQIEGRHIVAALTSMQKFYEKSSVPFSAQTSSIDFINMCSILRRNLTKLELPELIQSLKVLNLFKVSSSTFLIQSILQLIRCSINDLYLEYIYYLSFLLKQMEPTNLSKAILQALPEVFVAQLKLQIDKDNVKELGNALRYACNENIDENIIKFILDAIDKKINDIDIDTAGDIFISLCKIKGFPYNYMNTLDNLQNIIFDNVNAIELKKVVVILLQIIKRTLSRDKKFYSPYLVDALIEKVIFNENNIQQKLIFLNKLNLLRHINIPLLDSLSSEIHKNPSLLSTCNPWTISTLVTGLAIADYKPQCWNKLQQIILDRYSSIPDDAGLYYLALNLISLDCFDETLIRHVFTKSQDLQLLSSNFYQTYQLLYQVVKTLYPTYNGPWPSEDLIQSFKIKHANRQPKPSPLLPALEIILGGPAFVQSNVMTNLGHVIDHLIILENGSPVAVKPHIHTSSNLFINEEDLTIAPEYERVALLFLPFEAHGRNIHRLKGSVLLNIKSLESMSYKVVYIREYLWSTMSEHDRLPYLKHLIGLKNISK